MKGDVFFSLFPTLNGEKLLSNNFFFYPGLHPESEQQKLVLICCFVGWQVIKNVETNPVKAPFPWRRQVIISNKFRFTQRERLVWKLGIPGLSAMLQLLMVIARLTYSLSDNNVNINSRPIGCVIRKFSDHNSTGSIGAEQFGRQILHDKSKV